ncbi:MAG: DUF4876 domain-containing protein [Candidatus Marinimicrobia bacterium]|nr:DUF4876 domain-containing protein [Candidatus Neomarinimicrobiota bacterium]
MKIKKPYQILLLSLWLIMTSCFLSESKPEVVDGNLSINLKFTILSEDDSTVMLPVADLPVKIYTNDYNIPPMFETTDDSGWAHFEHLPYAHYIVEAFTIVRPSEYEEIEVVGAKSLNLTVDSLGTDMTYTDTLLMEQSKSGLKINEIYTCGPPNNIYYFYDQFFELYNGMSETVYLDGMIFLRLSGTPLFADTLSVTYIYQFPGQALTGREYPVEPGTFVVLAGNAFDHNLIGPIAGKTVDLSHADWEFYNNIESAAYDNPNVPNITTNNGRVSQSSKVDFMVGLNSDELALCDGSDYDQSDGIDINTVVDCVEFSAIAHHIKQVPYSVDASWAGIGQSKYSGQSLERIRPGFDTNSSGIDFIIINTPTPGYHHE